MPEKEEKKEVVNVEKDAVANTKNFSTIPNSNSEFCIYTYKAETETYSQIMKPHFFNSAAMFLNPGDTVRVFQMDSEKNLTNYTEFIVMKVDKLNRTVRVATASTVNLEKKILE